MYYPPGLNVPTISSCLEDDKMIKISQEDERLYSEVDMVEEFQIAGIGLLILNIIVNITTCVKNYLDNKRAQNAAPHRNAQREGENTLKLI